MGIRAPGGWQCVVAGGLLIFPFALGCEPVAAPRIPELRRVPPLPEGALDARGGGAGLAVDGRAVTFRARASGVRLPVRAGVMLELSRATGVVRLTPDGRVEWLQGEGEGVLEVRGARLGVEGWLGSGEVWRARVRGGGVPLGVVEGWRVRGAVSGEAELRGRGDRLDAVEIRWLEWKGGSSRVALRGRGLAGKDGWRDPRLEDLLVEAAPLRIVDLLGSGGGGDWVGWARAEGAVREGVRVHGELSGEVGPGAAAGESGGDTVPSRDRGAAGIKAPEGVGALELGTERRPSHFAFAGTVHPLPSPYLNLSLNASPVRMADTAFMARLQLRGEPDSLQVEGSVGLRGEEAVVGIITGRVSLPGGALQLRIAADSLPLAVLPWPAATVDSVSGVLAAEVEVGGTVGVPVVSGRAELRPGRLRLRRLGLVLDSLQGVARYEEGVLAIDSLSARGAGGSFLAEGSVRSIDGAHNFEAAVHAAGVRWSHGADAELLMTADLGIVGPLSAPRLSGRIYEVSGQLHADLFRGPGALDLTDPPYAGLARAVPWPASSRLRRAGGRKPPPMKGEVVVEVTPGVRVVSDDSELYGSGRIRVAVDSGGVQTHGVLELEGGHYAFFGERFTIIGGAVHFDGAGLAPRLALLAEHEGGGGLSSGLQETTTAPAHYPPFTYFLLGRAASARGRILHAALVPERAEQLAEQLMYGLEPDPVAGWQNLRSWLPDRPGSPFNHRAMAQAAPLLWSYIANEGYRLVPVTRGWLVADNVVTGSAWSGRLVVGPVIGLGAAPGWRLEGLISQPVVGGAAPGLRFRRHLGAGGALDLFSESRFGPAAAEGPHERAYSLRRKTGVGVRWRWEF